MKGVLDTNIFISGIFWKGSSNRVITNWREGKFIKDNIFIETAVAGNVDYIVSQDNHLLKLKEFRGIKIIAPEEFNNFNNF